MKYLLRSIKYFAYLVIVLCLIIFILVKLKLVDGDVGTMFVNGYDSIWQIAIIIGVLSLLYPRFGYSHREARAFGDPSSSLPTLKAVMEEHGYRLNGEEEGSKLYVKRSPLARALKMWEDTVTVTKTMSGFDFEGHTKEIVRLVSALEYRLRDPEEDA